MTFKIISLANGILWMPKLKYEKFCIWSESTWTCTCGSKEAKSLSTRELE